MKDKQPPNTLRDIIINKALPEIPFDDGWHWSTIEHASKKAGHTPQTAKSLFPEKTIDAIAHFSDMADRAMRESVQNLDLSTMRIRDRILEIAMCRFTYLNTHKEAERLALQNWLLPANKLKSIKILWRTCDHIWTEAGDDSTDYNHYTKRGLLAGVLGSTSLAWLNDTSSDMIETRQFMERRINNVLKIGQTTGPYIDRFMKVMKR